MVGEFGHSVFLMTRRPDFPRLCQGGTRKQVSWATATAIATSQLLVVNESEKMTEVFGVLEISDSEGAHGRVEVESIL
jgi:NADH dehydrogenase/NADH:ubiquinone oxidoreductase subunit G